LNFREEFVIFGKTYKSFAFSFSGDGLANDDCCVDGTGGWTKNAVVPAQAGEWRKERGGRKGLGGQEGAWKEGEGKKGKSERPEIPEIPEKDRKETGKKGQKTGRFEKAGNWNTERPGKAGITAPKGKRGST
jgi:hypothetical protein